MLSRLPVAPVLRCTFCTEITHVLLLVYWAGTAGRFCCLPSLPSAGRWTFKSFGACDSTICCQRRGRRLSLVGRPRRQASPSMSCCSQNSPFPICPEESTHSVDQAIGVLPRCLLQKIIVCFVLAHIHGLVFILMLVHSDLAASKSRKVLFNTIHNTDE